MADAIFEEPRLAQIYDALDPDRSDLEVYLAIARELGAQRVLDIGSGTGTFALLLADHGVDVVGLEPAAASLDVARGKPGAERVRWIHGDARALPPLAVDLVTMTANVAQAIADPADWAATLAASFAVLRPGGHLVFETRDPARRAWAGWTREQTYTVTDVPGVGRVEDWNQVTDVALPLVTFEGVFVFASDGARLTSTSTLAFRERVDIEQDLAVFGFQVIEVRDAPDRPSCEFVFIARRPLAQ
ncbi:MAG TPA: class I SAM-dependent methyltransferase [Jatrophihabitans sp.]